MSVDNAKCASFWAEFIASLAADDPSRLARPDAFGFGGAGEIADELAALVLAGRKRATASLPIEYTALNEPLPQTGDLSIILDGKGDPVGIIERTSLAARSTKVLQSFASAFGLSGHDGAQAPQADSDARGSLSAAATGSRLGKRRRWCAAYCAVAAGFP